MCFLDFSLLLLRNVIRMLFGGSLGCSLACSLLVLWGVLWNDLWGLSEVCLFAEGLDTSLPERPQRKVWKSVGATASPHDRRQGGGGPASDSDKEGKVEVN